MGGGHSHQPRPFITTTQPQSHPLQAGGAVAGRRARAGGDEGAHLCRLHPRPHPRPHPTPTLTCATPVHSPAHTPSTPALTPAFTPRPVRSAARSCSAGESSQPTHPRARPAQSRAQEWGVVETKSTPSPGPRHAHARPTSFRELLRARRRHRVQCVVPRARDIDVELMSVWVCEVPTPQRSAGRARSRF